MLSGSSLPKFIASSEHAVRTKNANRLIRKALFIFCKGK